MVADNGVSGGPAKGRFDLAALDTETDVEEVFQLRGGDSRSRIANPDIDFAILSTGIDADFSRSIDGLDGVFEQVHKDLVSIGPGRNRAA